MTVYATAADVTAALRREMTANEEEYVEELIAEAQDLVEAFLRRADGTTYAYESDEDVPGAVTRVTASMVARVFKQDAQNVQIGASQTQMTAGPFSVGGSFVAGATTGSPWLAGSDKAKLAPYRVGGGMTSMVMASERGYDGVS